VIHTRVSFLAGLALGMLAAPLAGDAQPAGTVYRVGFLGTVVNPQTTQFISAFTHGLREHGYIDGQNLRIERRYSEGKTERFPDLIAELVRLPVDVIVAPGTGPALAAKQATSTIPIVTVLVELPGEIGVDPDLVEKGRARGIRRGRRPSAACRGSARLLTACGGGGRTRRVYRSRTKRRHRRRRCQARGGRVPPERRRWAGSRARV
jgi:hypothetical protein